MVPKPTIHSNEGQQIFHSKLGKNPVIMFCFFPCLVLMKLWLPLVETLIRTFKKKSLKPILTVYRLL